MTITIVVPTIRQNSTQKFLEAWGAQFSDAHLIVVEDNPTKTFSLPYPNLTHYSWEDIERTLGKDAWIIPRRTDCIRSFGYFMAYQEQPDMIVTLDDDCYPEDENFLEKHWKRLQEGGSSVAWCETGDGVVSRGVPYFNQERKLECVINHGMWNNVPDYDAPTQLLQKRYPREFSWTNRTIPVGMYFPMCGMNLAFRAKVVPALYFLLMGKDYEFDRFGDIWAGIFVKKICDHLGHCINSGEPAVRHERASNVWANLRKEAPGLEVNEVLWREIDSIVLTKTNFKDCYKELANNLKLDGNYWQKLKRAMNIWADFF